MRQGSNPKGRSHGRGSNSKKGGPIRTDSFDGAPSARGRGNAHQLMDKYLALARDASTVGDRVLAENYFQHADHYYRVISSLGNANGRGLRQPLPQTTPAVPIPEIDQNSELKTVKDNTKENEEGSVDIVDF